MNTPIATPYEDLLRDVLAHGTHKEDRTGTGTTSVFGRQLRYDLSEGFPLITTKRVHFRSIALELLWFLRGDGNVRWLQERGVTIWDDWRRPYTLDRELVIVERREAHPDASYDGGFGCGLNPKAMPVGSVERGLLETWIRMMRRCYEASSSKYALYGAKGATVHPRWHSVDAFVEDAKKLPHWEYKAADWSNFDLDKDYYGANQYGPDTSVWLRHDENTSYRSDITPVEVVTPQGNATQYLTQAAAARSIGMTTSTMNRILNEGVPTILKGANRAYIGWEFNEIPTAEDALLRLALIPDGDLGPVYGVQWRSWPTPDGGGIDQIAKAVDTIKNNPDSRRIMVTAWNPAEVDNMALPPCHALFQFYVADGKLSCQLYQRSADLFLGVPFNIASYALLTMMIAEQTGLEPGEFVWTGGDCHIYDNHREQVVEQLSREPFPYPTLELKKAASVFEYTLDDFEVVGYRHHPSIKAPVAV